MLRYALLPIALTGFLATSIAFFDDWHWRADLFAQLRPQYCVWLCLGALGAFVLKHRFALVLALVGLLANAVALMPQAVPWHEAEDQQTTGRTWTFVSVNLLHGNREVARVTSFLRSVQADVVVFQEVSPRWEAELEELRDIYPHRFTRSRKDNFGIAVFSRVKPVEVTIRAVGERIGDLAVFAVWESEGRRFGLAGIHPDKPDEEWKTRNRRTYLWQVARWCEEKLNAKEPVIVIGDFNATPWSSSMRQFARDTALRNTSQGVIFGATWNVWQPHRLLIDHAFLSSQWTLLDREVGPAIGSDHRPLLVRTALQPEQANDPPKTPHAR